MKHLNLQQKIMLSFCTLLLCVLGVLGVTMIPSRMTDYNKTLDNDLSLVARLVSESEDVQESLINNMASEESIKRLDALTNDIESVDYIVVANPDSIRIYHPDHTLIGKTFVGDDELPALKGKESYLTTGQGTQASQRRAFHSVYDSNGKVIGFVMASASLDTINSQKNMLLIQFLLLFAIVLVAGLLVSYILSKNIRKTLLGNEPNDFAQMYLQRQEVLDHLNECLIAIDSNRSILYLNKKGKEIVGGSILPDDFPFSCQTDKDNEWIEWKKHVYISKCVPLDDNCILMILRDHTEYAKIDRQLTGTNHVIEALRANTHEFLNKLHVILGLLQVGEVDEAINFISDVSKDVENNYQRVINQINNRTVAALILGKASHARELGIQFSLRRDSYLPRHSSYLSSQEFVTIVGNLVENAFDAVKNKAELRQVGLFIGEDKKGLIIAVDDTGNGMSQEQIDTLKKKQYSTKGEGHGFGLRLIQKIVSDRKGYLEIESEMNEGSSFTISFTVPRKDD